MTFDPTWLALREPYDHAVRDPDLTRAFVDALGEAPELIDLGSGTGSNLRYLAPYLPSAQRWICVDHDPQLLARLEMTKPATADVMVEQLDLAKGLESLRLRPGMGVTSAALLDLTSAAWLDRLARHCRDTAVLMTLSFDGRVIWDPIDPADAAITMAFCRHQGSDKGFGPALGPDAADYFVESLEHAGHRVRVATSDWVFGPADESILSAMVDGIAQAAGEFDPDLPLDAWRARRLLEIQTSALSLTVGHLDLLGLPECLGLPE
ncbi:MAG: class I SAM-dependent methyltransferase [Pseudomonadota bacterium]